MEHVLKFPRHSVLLPACCRLWLLLAEVLRRYRLSNEDDVKSYLELCRESILEPVLDFH